MIPWSSGEACYSAESSFSASLPLAVVGVEGAGQKRSVLPSTP